MRPRRHSSFTPSPAAYGEDSPVASAHPAEGSNNSPAGRHNAAAAAALPEGPFMQHPRAISSSTSRILPSSSQHVQSLETRMAPTSLTGAGGGTFTASSHRLPGAAFVPTTSPLHRSDGGAGAVSGPPQHAAAPLFSVGSLCSHRSITHGSSACTTYHSATTPTTHLPSHSSSSNEVLLFLNTVEHPLQEVPSGQHTKSLSSASGSSRPATATQFRQTQLVQQQHTSVAAAGLSTARPVNSNTELLQPSQMGSKRCAAATATTPVIASPSSALSRSSRHTSLRTNNSPTISGALEAPATVAGSSGLHPGHPLTHTAELPHRRSSDAPLPPPPCSEIQLQSASAGYEDAGGTLGSLASNLSSPPSHQPTPAKDPHQRTNSMQTSSSSLIEVRHTSDSPASRVGSCLPPLTAEEESRKVVLNKSNSHVTTTGLNAFSSGSGHKGRETSSTLIPTATAFSGVIHPPDLAGVHTKASSVPSCTSSPAAGLLTNGVFPTPSSHDRSGKGMLPAGHLPTSPSTAPLWRTSTSMPSGAGSEPAAFASTTPAPPSSGVLVEESLSGSAPSPPPMTPYSPSAPHSLKASPILRLPGSPEGHSSQGQRVVTESLSDSFNSSSSRRRTRHTIPASAMTAGSRLSQCPSSASPLQAPAASPRSRSGSSSSSSSIKRDPPSPRSVDGPRRKHQQQWRPGPIFRKSRPITELQQQGSEVTACLPARLLAGSGWGRSSKLGSSRRFASPSAASHDALNECEDQKCQEDLNQVRLLFVMHSSRNNSGAEEQQEGGKGPSTAEGETALARTAMKREARGDHRDESKSSKRRHRSSRAGTSSSVKVEPGADTAQAERNEKERKERKRRNADKTQRSNCSFVLLNPNGIVTQPHIDGVPQPALVSSCRCRKATKVDSTSLVTSSDSKDRDTLRLEGKGSGSSGTNTEGTDGGRHSVTATTGRKSIDGDSGTFRLRHRSSGGTHFQQCSSGFFSVSGGLPQPPRTSDGAPGSLPHSAVAGGAGGPVAASEQDGLMSASCSRYMYSIANYINGNGGTNGCMVHPSLSTVLAASRLARRSRQQDSAKDGEAGEDEEDEQQHQQAGGGRDSPRATFKLNQSGEVEQSGVGNSPMPFASLMGTTSTSSQGAFLQQMQQPHMPNFHMLFCSSTTSEGDVVPAPAPPVASASPSTFTHFNVTPPTGAEESASGAAQVIPLSEFMALTAQNAVNVDAGGSVIGMSGGASTGALTMSEILRHRGNSTSPVLFGNSSQQQPLQLGSVGSRNTCSSSCGSSVQHPPHSRHHHHRQRPSQRYAISTASGKTSPVSASPGPFAALHCTPPPPAPDQIFQPGATPQDPSKRQPQLRGLQAIPAGHNLSISSVSLQSATPLISPLPFVSLGDYSMVNPIEGFDPPEMTELSPELRRWREAAAGVRRSGEMPMGGSPSRFLPGGSNSGRSGRSPSAQADKSVLACIESYDSMLYMGPPSPPRCARQPSFKANSSSRYSLAVPSCGSQSSPLQPFYCFDMLNQPFHQSLETGEEVVASKACGLVTGDQGAVEGLSTCFGGANTLGKDTLASGANRLVPTFPGMANIEGSAGDGRRGGSAGAGLLGSGARSGTHTPRRGGHRSLRNGTFTLHAEEERVFPSSPSGTLSSSGSPMNGPPPMQFTPTPCPNAIQGVGAFSTGPQPHVLFGLRHRGNNFNMSLSSQQADGVAWAPEEDLTSDVPDKETKESGETHGEVEEVQPVQQKSQSRTAEAPGTATGPSKGTKLPGTGDSITKRESSGGKSNHPQSSSTLTGSSGLRSPTPPPSHCGGNNDANDSRRSPSPISGQTSPFTFKTQASSRLAHLLGNFCFAGTGHQQGPYERSPSSFYTIGVGSTTGCEPRDASVTSRHNNSSSNQASISVINKTATTVLAGPPMQAIPDPVTPCRGAVPSVGSGAEEPKPHPPEGSPTPRPLHPSGSPSVASSHPTPSRRESPPAIALAPPSPLHCAALRALGGNATEEELQRQRLAAHNAAAAAPGDGPTTDHQEKEEKEEVGVGVGRADSNSGMLHHLAPPPLLETEAISGGGAKKGAGGCSALSSPMDSATDDPQHPHRLHPTAPSSPHVTATSPRCFRALDLKDVVDEALHRGHRTPYVTSPPPGPGLHSLTASVMDMGPPMLPATAVESLMQQLSLMTPNPATGNVDVLAPTPEPRSPTSLAGVPEDCLLALDLAPPEELGSSVYRSACPSGVFAGNDGLDLPLLDENGEMDPNVILITKSTPPNTLVIPIGISGGEKLVDAALEVRRHHPATAQSSPAPEFSTNPSSSPHKHHHTHSSQCQRSAGSTHHQRGHTQRTNSQATTIDNNSHAGDVVGGHTVAGRGGEASPVASHQPSTSHPSSSATHHHKTIVMMKPDGSLVLPGQSTEGNNSSGGATSAAAVPPTSGGGGPAGHGEDESPPMPQIHMGEGAEDNAAAAGLGARPLQCNAFDLNNLRANSSAVLTVGGTLEREPSPGYTDEGTTRGSICDPSPTVITTMTNTTGGLTVASGTSITGMDTQPSPPAVPPHSFLKDLQEFRLMHFTQQQQSTPLEVRSGGDAQPRLSPPGDPPLPVPSPPSGPLLAPDEEQPASVSQDLDAPLEPPAATMTPHTTSKIMVGAEMAPQPPAFGSPSSPTRYFTCPSGGRALSFTDSSLVHVVPVDPSVSEKRVKE